MMNEDMRNKTIEDDGLTRQSIGSFPLVSLMENSNEIWAAKNLKSQFIYGNQVLQKISKLPAGFNMEGRLDHEIPTPWSEFEPELQAHDRRVEQSKDSVSIIGTHFFGREQQPYLFEKFPLFNEAKECVGTIFHGRKFNFLSISEYFNKLTPYVLVLNPPIELFTDKELEVIFFALQPLNIREIAKKLNRSHRTIENKLQDIYRKSNVNSLSMLRECCRSVGLDQYIPLKLVQPGIQFI